MVKKSMTEAEAIEIIRKAMEFSISAIAELDKAKEKIDMVGLAGEYYENKENCEREIAACMLAINALKEIQEYRAISTVEECREAREGQKPKKPNRYSGVSMCPECGRKSLRCYDYCPGCGQAIEWSET